MAPMKIHTSLKSDDLIVLCRFPTVNNLTNNSVVKLILACKKLRTCNYPKDCKLIHRAKLQETYENENFQ